MLSIMPTFHWFVVNVNIDTDENNIMMIPELVAVEKNAPKLFFLDWKSSSSFIKGAFLDSLNRFRDSLGCRESGYTSPSDEFCGDI